MRLGGGVSDMDIYSYAGVGTCPFLGILNITFKYLLEIFGDYIPNSSVMLNWTLTFQFMRSLRHVLTHLAMSRNVAAALTHAVAALEISPGAGLKPWKMGQIERISEDKTS